MKRASRKLPVGQLSAMLFSSALLMGHSRTSAGDEIFDARGFNHNRDFFSQLPYEHIDPLTGNLLLTFTDLVLPGNAGLDLTIQRTYNSKIYRDYMNTGFTLDEDSWAGVGWILHLGRVMNVGAVVPGPIEMPDGSRHKLYNRISSVDGFGQFVTKDFWVFSKSSNPPTLRLPNGLLYTFGYQTTVSGQLWAYVTEIRDPFSNTITVSYGLPNAPDGISSITQNLGTRTRQVSFIANNLGRGELDTMSYIGSQTFTWSYTQIAASAAGFSLLTAVTPPTGPGWGHGYDATTSELTSLTTPNGGTIGYTYAEQTFHLGSTVPIRSRSVTQRLTGGRGVTAGTWTYQYAFGSQQNQSVITTKQGPTTIRTETWTFNGVGNYSTMGNVWKIGLPASRTLVAGGTTLEGEQLTWGATSAALPLISNDIETVGFNQDIGIRAPQLSTRTVTRGGTNYTTTHTYSPSNFADFGRPNQSVETGSLGTRTTTRTFFYDVASTLYIKDLTASETVQVGVESFARRWQYNTNGFRTQETNYGVATDYTPDSRGNVASRTNANGHATTFAYDWAVVNGITPPVSGTGTTRAINAEGTVASEMRRGFTTSFAYDRLFRPTQRTPPVGNVITSTYNASGGAFVSTTVTRGSSVTTTTLDGFGRATATSNSVGVQTSTTYDALGRKTYVSYPFQPSAYPNIGTTYAYDGLDRVTLRTNPDGHGVGYAYSTVDGIDVTITDEMSHVTTQNWAAFGDPREARLVSVTEPGGAVTSYLYNALASLTTVTPPTGPLRTWHYNAKNQLDSVTHPEAGTVTYTYYPAGNLQTKTDAAFGTTTNTYDANERLTGISHQTGTAYNTTIGFDGSDNRASLQNAYVNSTFTYDGANRLTRRQDGVNAQTLTTTYTPDGNDNIQRIDYPSGNAVLYAYDGENRIATVTNGVTTTYADNFQYHPSGSPLSFKPGGSSNLNSAQSFTYDNRYRLQTLNTGQRSFTYGYDFVGNTTSIAEGTRSGKTSRPSIGYDALDRLTSVTGFASGGYTYDGVGNRVTSSVAQTPANYTYDSNTRRLVSFTGSGTLTYDGNGNLTNDGRTYRYTPENLLEVVQPSSPVATYRYDGDNVRTMKIDNIAQSTHYYIHGPGAQILSEFEEACAGNRTLVRDYVYANGRLLAEVKPAVPTVQLGFSQPTSSAGESVGTWKVGVQITTANGAPTLCPVTVQYTTVDGTAIAGTNYTTTTGSLTFPAGSPNGTTRNIGVPIIDNTLCQANSSFSLQLSGASGASVVTGTHTVTIVDDDLVCVSGTKSFTGGANPGGPVVYTVVLANSGSQPQRDNAGHEFADALSSFLTLDSVTASSGTPTRTGNTAFWDGVINPGGPVTITMNTHANANSALQVIANTGTINYDLHNTGSNSQTTSTNSISFVVGSGPTQFFTVTPCRIVDTRNPAGPVGGPSLSALVPRDFPIAGYCNIPSTATAVALNVTVVNPTALGHVALYPVGIPTPLTSTINYSAGAVRANNAVVILIGGQLEAYCGQASGTTDLVIDVTGYFQ